MPSLTYTVEQDAFVRYWLCSDVQATAYHAAMVPMYFENYHPGFSTKTSDGKEIVSPAKEQFIREGSFLDSSYPNEVPIDRVYWPFDTDRVDFSGMWIYPCDLRFYARTYIKAERASTASFELLCSGAVKLWVNGEEQLRFAPYESNIEQRISCKIELRQGLNELVVGCNDYGERNILLKFGLRNKGNELTFHLPCEVDNRRLEQAMTFLKTLRLPSLSFSEGNLTILSSLPAPWDILLKISTSTTTHHILFPKDSYSMPWCDVEDLGLGSHQTTLSTEIESVTLSVQLFVETYPRSYRLGPTTNLEGRKQAYRSFVLRYQRPSYDKFIAALQERKNTWDEHKAILEEDLLRVQKRSDCADFRSERFIWLLKRYPNLLTERQRERIEESLLGFRYWYDEKGNDAMWFFSENHALAFHTAELLAGEMFPDRVFSNSTLTGKEHARKAKALLETWFAKLLQYGYNEWNSANYIPVDMVSYFTLLELTEDQTVRSLAKKALDYTFTLFASMCHRGMLNGASGRVYARDLLASRTQDANAITYIAWDGGNPSFSSAALFFSLSSYEPPLSLQSIATWDSEALFEEQSLQGTNRVPTYVCKNKDFIIATSGSPREGGPGSQEHLFNCMVGDYRGRFWINHPGELKVFGTRRPGYFTGNALTPKVSAYKNSAVITYRFNAEFLDYVEADYTHLIFQLDAFDEVVRTEKHLFARRGPVFVCIWAANGLLGSRIPSLKDRELISEGLSNTWYVRLALSREISWESFCQVMASLSFQEKEAAIEIDDWQWGKVSYQVLPPVTVEQLQRRR